LQSKRSSRPAEQSAAAALPGNDNAWEGVRCIFIERKNAMFQAFREHSFYGAAQWVPAFALRQSLNCVR
jgi:hypothetical protein